MPNTGKPRGPYRNTKPAIERFCRKVTVPQDATQCWIWTGARRPSGHGMFAPNGREPRNTHAHRWLYQYVHGVTLPSDITINHHCDNPPCVNPAHLYAGTQQDNVRDMVARGRQAQGAHHPHAIFTAEEVRAIRSSTLSAPALARKYNTNGRLIRRILNRKTYKNI